MDKDLEIERKLRDKEYLEEIQQGKNEQEKKYGEKKYEVEIILRMIELYPNIEVLELIDPRTINSWKKKKVLPKKKSTLKEIRKTQEYSEVLEEFIREKVEEYEKLKYYIIGLEEPLKPIPTDEIEARLLNKKIDRKIEEGYEKLKYRVDGLKPSMEVNDDIGHLQYITFFNEFLNFYKENFDADLRFNQYFSKQYRLFNQLLKEEIELSVFIVEMNKLLENLYALIEYQKEN